MRRLTTLAILVVLAGCAAPRAAAPPAGAQTFSGQVWNWDERESTVTLLQDGGGLVRVSVTPDQLWGLRLHERARVVGTPAPPPALHTVTGTPGPVSAVPRGEPQVVEVSGTVTAADPGGRVALVSDRGALHLLAAAGADQRFPVGSSVRARFSVQPVDLVPAAAPPPAPAPVGGPVGEPGDHAVVTGRIVGINPGGVLVVESPTGPIQVLAADSSRYAIGQAVEVRSTLRAP
jgi:hypothetical protein